MELKFIHNFEDIHQHYIQTLTLNIEKGVKVILQNLFTVDPIPDFDFGIASFPITTRLVTFKNS